MNEAAESRRENGFLKRAINSDIAHVVARASIEIGIPLVLYFACSGVDTLISDMSFKEAVAEPLTPVKVGGYIAYAGSLVGRLNNYI